jgi:signal transduction histidine kinase
MELSEEIEALQLTECRLAQQRLTMQYAVSCILMEASTLEEAVKRTLQIIGEGQGWEVGNFWLLDMQTSLLYCSTIWHTPSGTAVTFETTSKQVRLPRGVGLPGRVWLTGNPAWIPNIQEDDNFPRFEVARHVGLQGAFAFPIRGSSGFLGVIEFFSQEIRSPDDELMQTVMSIGNQIGQLIEKKRTEEEHRRLLKHLEVDHARLESVLTSLLKLAELLVSVPESTLHGDHDTAGRTPSGMLSEESGIGQQLVGLTRNIIGCERVSITALDSQTNELRSVAVTGISAEQEDAWRTRRPGSYLSRMFQDGPPLLPNQAHVIDMTQPPFCDYPNPYGIQTMLLAPMYVADQIVGLLTLDHAGARHEYTEEEIALTSTIAKLAAMVIERERLLQERAEARSSELSLREANRRMDEFLSIASHELRSPLTSIKGNIQLAQRSLKSVCENSALASEISHKLRMAGTTLERAERQIRVLNRLVDDLVDISRIQADKLDLQMQLVTCDLVSIVSEIVQEQRKLHSGRPIGFTVFSQKPVTVLADVDRIGQVVTNYLTNALKYSGADRPVDVSLQADEQIVRVCVHDEGPGLSPTDQQRIWERFYQAENVEAQTSSRTGLGLGLYICKTIIERHHGQVGVQSSPGNGSTFWFTLPLV